MSNLPIKHVSGKAFQVRFNGQAATPAFNLKGTSILPYDNKRPLIGRILAAKGIYGAFFTKKDEIPVEKNWIEIYYLDEKNRFCATLFHNESAEAFVNAFEETLFENHIETLSEVKMSVTSVKKKNKDGIEYKIAQFEITSDENWEEKMAEAQKRQLQFFRLETLNAKVIFNDGCMILGKDGDLTANVFDAKEYQSPLIAATNE